jgi:hypothetical protein
VLLCYPFDPLVPRGQVTLACLSVPWVQTLGRVMTEKFPYWFDDNWLDEVATMVQRKFPVDTIMVPLYGKGKTRRMRNLPFWQNYYSCNFDERYADAERLRALIWQGDEEGIAASRRYAEAAVLLPSASGQTADETLVQMETNLSAHAGEKREEIPASYWDSEGRAIRELRGKAEACLEGGDVPRALGMLATIAKAYRQIDDSVERLRALRAQFPGAFRDNIVETQYRRPLGPGEGPVTALEAPAAPPEPAPRRAPAPGTNRQRQAVVLGQHAMNLMKAGEMKLAEGLLATAILTDDKLPELRYGHALALVNLRRYADAIQAAEGELSINPAHDGARSLLQQLAPFRSAGNPSR